MSYRFFPYYVTTGQWRPFRWTILLTLLSAPVVSFIDDGEFVWSSFKFWLVLFFTAYLIFLYGVTIIYKWLMPPYPGDESWWKDWWKDWWKP